MKKQSQQQPKTKIEKRIDQFHEETPLLITMVNNRMNQLNNEEQQLIIESIINQYFDDENVKRRLTIVDRQAKNSNGIDVRSACSKMVDEVISANGLL